MRQPSNCFPKAMNNTVHASRNTSDCLTRSCTVQFTNNYWVGTDINTHFVFLSEGKTVKKFCYWNHNLHSNQIIITECKDEAMGFLQVSHTLQVLVNFGGDKNLIPQ